MQAKTGDLKRQLWHRDFEISRLKKELAQAKEETMKARQEASKGRTLPWLPEVHLVLLTPMHALHDVRIILSFTTQLPYGARGVLVLVEHKASSLRG